MFKFLEMYGNYEERKVARTEIDGGFISTAYVNDSPRPFETAILHEKYNEGKLIIVECYDTKEDAEQGHKEWEELMGKNPPFLTDRAEDEIAELMSSIGGDAHKIHFRTE